MTQSPPAAASGPSTEAASAQVAGGLSTMNVLSVAAKYAGHAPHPCGAGSVCETNVTSVEYWKPVAKVSVTWHWPALGLPTVSQVPTTWRPASESAQGPDADAAVRSLESHESTNVAGADSVQVLGHDAPPVWQPQPSASRNAVVERTVALLVDKFPPPDLLGHSKRRSSALRDRYV
jgi:hypothetical protein